MRVLIRRIEAGVHTLHVWMCTLFLVGRSPRVVVWVPIREMYAFFERAADQGASFYSSSG